MTKLRSNSAWSGLSAEQRAKLESWLFERNLGFRQTLELARGEFGLKTSLTSLKMFYKRLAEEREERRVNDELLEYLNVEDDSEKTLELVRATSEKLTLVKMIQLVAQSGGNAHEFIAVCRMMTANSRIDLERMKMRQLSQLKSG